MKKTVKGWAVVTNKGKLKSTYLIKREAKWIADGEQYVSELKVVPCAITYEVEK